METQDAFGSLPESGDKEPVREPAGRGCGQCAPRARALRGPEGPPLLAAVWRTWGQLSA